MIATALLSLVLTATAAPHLELAAGALPPLRIDRSVGAASELALEAGQNRLLILSEEIGRVIGRRPPGFALLSYLEKRATDAGVKGNIRSMNLLPPVSTGAYEETTVEMKLDKLTMKQLTDFLYQAELPEEMIRIRRISIVKMKESPEYLSALIQVFTYQPLAPRSR